MQNTKVKTQNERPILFSDCWVQLILRGKKCQTRRPASRGDLNPPASIGDRLWVREKFLPCKGTFYRPIKIEDASFVCFSDGAQKCRAGQYFSPVRKSAWPADAIWRPSIHMPRWACRVILQVTDVRLEPLLTITERDARAEGVSSARVFARLWKATYPAHTDLCWAPTFGWRFITEPLH